MKIVILILIIGSIRAAHLRGLSRLYIPRSRPEPSIPGYAQIADIESSEPINVVDATPLIYIPNPDTDTERIDTDWLINRTQFDFSLPVYAAIFGLSTCWDKKGLEYQIAKATYILTILNMRTALLRILLICINTMRSCLFYKTFDFSSNFHRHWRFCSFPSMGPRSFFLDNPRTLINPRRKL